MYNLGNADKNMLVTKTEENKYYDENIVIDINDTNNTHSIIASKIKEGSTVLDIGCGAGYIGVLLKDKKCKVYGIDVDSKALETAKSKECYKKVFNFSITEKENENYKKFFKEKIEFDYIIFADVLEHVVNPGEIIFELSKKLKKDGEILISLPNVAHMDITRGLINRTFNYNKIGLLDNTHLRFFTKSSFYDMIESINAVYNTKFSVKMIGKTINTPWYVDKYPNINNLLNDDEEFYVLQYVYSIKNSTKKNTINQIKYIDYYEKIENILHNQYNLENKIEKLKIENKDLENKNQNNLKNAERLEMENQYLKELLNNEINNYENIINSKSWKITAPLRRIVAIIKKKKSD